MGPFGQWTKDQSNPGNANLISLPIDPNIRFITPVTIFFSNESTRWTNVKTKNN